MSSEATREKTHFVVVDNHPAIRKALWLQVESDPEMQMQGGSASSKEALSLIDEHSPDVVVVDISLRDTDGLTFIQEIRSEVPDVRILVYSQCDEDFYAERAIEAGASGYIMKTKPTEEVVRAIQAVSQGEVFLSRNVASQILGRLIQSSGDAEVSPSEKLTDRELTVFRKIGEGNTVRQIAGQLDLSRKTVEKYRQRAKEKLGHETIKELLRHAVHWINKNPIGQDPTTEQAQMAGAASSDD